MAGTDTTTQTLPVDEGFLHSLATSLGVEPEQVKAAAKAIYEHPVATAEAVGGEAASEVKDAVTHPGDTAKQTLAGARDLVTNPEAQATAKSRLAAPGAMNKVEGATEYLESGVPLVGGNLVKATEQAGAGNLKGAVGTTVGTIAPMLTGEEAAAPKAEVPHVAFDEIGGKEVRGPKSVTQPTPEIQSEGPEWDRTHTAVIDGKKVGSVGYKLDPGGRAQIYGSQVSPELRGKGIGQKLYQTAIDDAKAAGATHITSDSTNTSLDANRVWEKLKDKGQPVEEITHPNGKPGYQIDFENPPESEKPGVPPAHEFEAALARRGELPGQTVNLSPAYGDTGRYVGGNLEARAKGKMTTANAEDFTKNLGPYRGSGLMDIPTSFIGNFGDTHSTISHELAHAVVGEMMGLPPDGAGIKSHMHPDNLGSGTTASIGLDWSNIPGAREVLPGRFAFNKEALGNAWQKFVTTYMAGGVAEDIGHGVPTKVNLGMGGDLEQVRKIGRIMGFSPAEVKDMADAGEKQARDILNHPETMDIIKQAAGEREPNLSKTLHMSPEKVQDVIKRVKEARNGITEGSGTIDSGNVSEAGSGGAGEAAQGNVRENNGQTVSPGDATRKVEPGTYHPDLQKVADKYGISESGDQLRRGASFITPDGKFIHLPAGVEHPQAIANARGDASYPSPEDEVDEPAGDNRIQFLNDTGAIRTRFSTDRAGPIMHISVPKDGVTAEQVPAIRQAVAQAGRNGNVVMERADVTPETKNDLTMSKEFPRTADTENYLRQINAHPEQHFEPSDMKKTTAEDWSRKAAALAKKQGSGFTIDPRTGEAPKTGFQVEFSPERRQILDHPATAQDIQKFYDTNKELFDANPDLHIGGFQNELDVSANVVNKKAAEQMAKKLDQKSIWDNAKGEEVPTGGANVAPKPPTKKSGKFNALDFIKNLDALKKPGGTK